MTDRDGYLAQLLPKGAQGPQGCAAAIISGSEIKLSEASGFIDLESETMVTATSSFYIASTSKMFTAICIALLVREDAMGFGDDVRDHVPELPKHDAQILISDLLWHTSGLRDYIELLRMAGHDMGMAFDNAGAIEMICRQRHLNFRPGSTRLYSNSNYVLLAEIVARVTGTSLRQFARERIFGPLRMSRTDFDDGTVSTKGDAPVSYLVTAEGIEPRINQFSAVGDGGVW